MGKQAAQVKQEAEEAPGRGQATEKAAVAASLLALKAGAQSSPGLVNIATAEYVEMIQYVIEVI